MPRAILGDAQGVELGAIARLEPQAASACLKARRYASGGAPRWLATDQLTSLRRDGDSGICSASASARRRIGSLSVLSARRLARTSGRSSGLS